MLCNLRLAVIVSFDSIKDDIDFDEIHFDKDILHQTVRPILLENELASIKLHCIQMFFRLRVTYFENQTDYYLPRVTLTTCIFYYRNYDVWKTDCYLIPPLLGTKTVKPNTLKFCRISKFLTFYKYSLMSDILGIFI